MKHLLFAAFLLLAAPVTVVAQASLSNKPHSSSPRFRSNGADNSGVGVKGGLNFNSVQGDGLKKLYNGKIDGLMQYHFGAYAQIGVNNWFSIQPELLYQRKGFKAAGDSSKIIYRNRANTADSASMTEINSDQRTIKLSYLSVPILLVFNVFNHIAIQVGPQFSYLTNVRNNGKTLVASAYNYKAVDIGLIGGIEAKIEFLRIGARYDYSLTDLRKAGAYTITNTSARTVTQRRAQSDIRNGVFQVYLGVGL